MLFPQTDGSNGQRPGEHIPGLTNARRIVISKLKTKTKLCSGFSAEATVRDPPGPF
jgi:hypothetical protein